MNTPATRLLQQCNPSATAQYISFSSVFLFLAAYHVYRSRVDEHYYGTGDQPWSDIDLGNTVTEIAENIFGIDFYDDPDLYSDETIMPWSTAIRGATTAEISQLLIRSMVRELTSMGVADTDSPLYMVLSATPDHTSFFDDPFSHANKVKLYSSEILAQQDAAISALNPFDALIDHQSCTIIRIR